MAATAGLLRKLGRIKITLLVIHTTTCSTFSTRKGVLDMAPACHQLLVFIGPLITFGGKVKVLCTIYCQKLLNRVGRKASLLSL